METEAKVKQAGLNIPQKIFEELCSRHTIRQKISRSRTGGDDFVILDIEEYGEKFSLALNFCEVGVEPIPTYWLSIMPMRDVSRILDGTGYDEVKPFWRAIQLQPKSEEEPTLHVFMGGELRGKWGVEVHNKTALVELDISIPQALFVAKLHVEVLIMLRGIEGLKMELDFDGSREIRPPGVESAAELVTDRASASELVPVD